MFDAHCDETSFVNLSLLALVYISGKEMSSPNRRLSAPSVPPNKKRPDGGYIVHLDGEGLIIAKIMVDAIDPQIMREYLRMLWAQEHWGRRGERCWDARGVRCLGKCSVCGKNYSGKPVSLEALTGAGVPFASGYSLEGDVEERLESWALQKLREQMEAGR